MTLKTFFSRLNWRLILMHILAFGFFIFAFQTMFFLTDVKIVDFIRNYDTNALYAELDRRKINHGYYIDFLTLYPFYAGFVGLLVAFFISLIISYRHSWFWVNSLIVFIVTLIMFFMKAARWNDIRRYFYFPGQAVTNSITTEFVINSILFLGIGLFIFLSALGGSLLKRRLL